MVAGHITLNEKTRKCEIFLIQLQSLRKLCSEKIKQCVYVQHVYLDRKKRKIK